MNEYDETLAQSAKPIRSQYVYARKMGTTETVMMTVDEAQRRGYLVFDYESRTYRPVDSVPPGVFKSVPTPVSVKD
jgi:hypothetical protein